MNLRRDVPCIMEISAYIGHLLAMSFIISTIMPLCNGCVTGCQCTMAGSAKRQKGRKVDCAQHPVPFTTVESVNFPPDTVHLNLAHNAIVTLKQASFIQLSSLQKLNLSNNQIAIIESGAFDGLQSLKKLDLSRNLIGAINSNMFSGLPKLNKLLLSNNHISVIPDGTFKELRSLKRIDFSSDHLHCDCHLKWILKWTKKQRVRIPRSTVCALPAKLRGQSLSKLDRKDLHCDHKIHLPIFDIRPSESQLVFHGDKLPFECHASVAPGKMEIAWFRAGQLVTTNKTIGVFVHTSHNLDHTVINHRLVVESLDSSHAGEWSCVVTTATGNLTKTVHVEVRPPVLLACPSVTNRTAKGIYIWDESMAGILASQPCQKGEKGAMATHKCGMDGRWKSLNTSFCSFMKDITRKLARFAKSGTEPVDIPSLIYGMNKALVTAAHSGESMDSFDISYVSKIMDILLPHSALNTGVASLLVNLVSNVSSLPPRIVDMTYMESRSPLRMVKILEQMSEEIISQTENLEWKVFSENVAVVVLGHQLLQSGVSCALLGNRDSLEHGFTGSNFYCSNVMAETDTQVYVHIPVMLADKSQDQTVGSGVTSAPTPSNDDLSLNALSNSSLEDIGNFSNSFTFSEASSHGPVLDLAADSNEDVHTDSVEPNLDTEQDLPSSASPHERTRPPTSYPPFTSSENHLEALNISSHYFSKFSKPINISSKMLLSLPSSLDLSARHLFPYVKNPVLVPTKPAPPSGQANVYVIMYRNGRLFPVIQSELSDGAFRQGNWAVVTPVVAVSTGRRAQQTSQPVVVRFTVSETRRPLKAAYFDFGIINGYGGWRTDGCEIVQQNGSIITVRVQHLSNFALLQDISYIYRSASFSMEPVIFVGSTVCILCMVVVIVTFIACFGSIGIPKKIKHAVVNVCISTLLLMLTFVFGINRTEVELPCQIVGVCIHYFTLCAVFWITVTTNIIYKKFMKASLPPEPPPELILMPLPPKPILQFYFVGYGVPLIICGITAAVNLNFYTGLQYCFLEWEPSLGAFYTPVALLVAWNLVLFMRIACVVKSISEADIDATNENDNEIHTNEIELVPSQPDTITTTTHKVSSCKANNNSSGTTGYHRRYSRASSDNEDEEEDAVSVKSIPDQERRPVTQLRSVVVILFLFIIMWMCAALAIARPFHITLPYLEIVFSYIYGLMSSLFGAFVILYFCVTRKDSWLSWKRVGQCSSPEICTNPMEVTEKPAELPKSPQPLSNGNVVKSNSNSNLSICSQKSSNITKAYNMKNNDNSKQSNINLIMPNSSDTSYGSSQDNFPNFYNARQNGAAKKFWHKHRHHSKIMNKDINRELNSSLTDNSAVELNNRLSNGTSSDANTHLSIEIQIQAKDKEGSFYGSKEIPVHISTYQQIKTQNTLGSSFGNALTGHNGQNSEISATADINHAFSPDNLQANPSLSISHLPQHQRSPSAGPTEAGVHHSAFAPVHPRSNDILSGQGMSEGNRGESAQRNQLSGSAPHEVDGQNQGNEAGQRPPNPGVAWNPLHCNLPPVPNHPAAYTFTPPPPPAHSQQNYPCDFGIYSPSLSMTPNVFNINQARPTGVSPTSFSQQHGHMPFFNILPSPYLIQSQNRGRIQSESSSSQSQSNRKLSSSGSWYPLSGGDSSDSCKPRKKLTHPGGSPGRTVKYTPRSPVLSDSQAYESSCQSNDTSQQGTDNARTVDTDHHSDPTHRKKPNRFGRHSRNKLTNKQRSLGWDEQFKDRPSKVNYVYVNHMYRDKVMHKLIKQASESDDLAKKAFWLPRSASEYERLTQKGFSNMSGDSSSSSDEDDSLDDNVWIRQSLGSEFCKKETSV